jgi:ferrous iron transport protein A
MERTLADLSVGDTGQVVGFVKGSKHYRQRLMAMGLTKDTPFSVTRTAPMGDPIEIQVRDYNLSLRKDEAMAVLVEGK